MSKHTIGNALVVYPSGNMTTAAQHLAQRVAPDSENDLVVVDLPGASPLSAWESVARVLPRRGRGVRLVIGGRSRETTALAGNWLAERLKRTVIVPDGPVVLGAGGSLFVHDGRRSGWMRCAPGRPPKWEAKRFPAPGWDDGVALENFPTSASGMAEPVPSGIWLRPIGDDVQLRSSRLRLIENVPCQPDFVTVALGSPGGVPLSHEDVALLWRGLPEQTRDRVRFVQYGPMTVPRAELGQAVADVVGREVVFYTGVPIGPAAAPEIFTVRRDGSFGWHAFAREMSYRPSGTGSPVPSLVSHRCPVPGAEELSPGVYRQSVDAVVEVVQSGLLVRPVAEPSDVDAIRAIPVDPATHSLMFHADDESDLKRMAYLANELAQQLGASVKPMNRVVSALSVLDEHVRPISGVASGSSDPLSVRVFHRPVHGQAAPSDEPAPIQTASAVPAALESEALTEVAERVAARPGPPIEVSLPVAQGTSGVFDAPVQPAGLGTSTPAVPSAGLVSPPDPVAVPVPAGTPAVRVGVDAADEPTPDVAHVQPIPTPEATGLLPKRGIEDERAWLRRTLGAEFGRMSNSLSRMLSEHPGFQGALSTSSTEVLTDAVAVQLYLTGRGEDTDRALRTAAVGPHVPFARCVVAGLGRLPSHRGPTVFSTSVGPAAWDVLGERRLFTEWGFLHALPEPQQDPGGNVDVLIWSMTARRTRLLEPADGVPQRLLYVPGSRFKVLELVRPEADARGRILMRELTTGEVDADGRVSQQRAPLDELALNSLQRKLEQWSAAPSTIRLGPLAAGRFGALPGLVRGG